jgi:hypothetical protein
MDWMEERYNPNLIKPKDTKWELSEDEVTNLFDEELEQYSELFVKVEIPRQLKAWMITQREEWLLRLIDPKDATVWLKANNRLHLDKKDPVIDPLKTL